jgi:predicted 2-oxoglutarate/Fe(II)-dependent dioxygenase YbiX
VYPNLLLEKQFDAKFRKTVFYKMQEVLCFKVKYRELYKICTYNHLTNGRFHAHRDTVPKYRDTVPKYSHRVYAMSVVLNDDYAGGELEFPEYHLKLKPRANTAIVFPGTYSHRVHPVTRGKRMTIITFLCKESEDRTTYNKQYWLKG